MPKPRLKALKNQRIVLTGATSGIGLATARAAASSGAALLLVARNEQALEALRGELRGRGARVEYVVADVADQEQVRAVARKAVESFGGFDAWVNNAGAFIYGTVAETPVEDQRRLFDVTYWGTVYGTLTAAEHLRTAGGAIVNVGSVLSDTTIPLQGSYCAAKHAVKSVTEAFRMEFEEAGHPISVTLIKPAAIDTPYVEHARNLLDSPGVRNPPPAYHPRVVARAILHACATPVRTLTVGGGGLAMSLLSNHAPRLSEILMEVGARKAQTTDQTGRSARRDNLYEPREDLSETSSLKGRPARKSSLLLEAQMHPLGTAGILIGVGALIAGAAWGMRANRRDRALRVGRGARREAYHLARLAAQESASLVERAAKQARRRAPAVRDYAETAYEGARHAAVDTGRDVVRRGSSLFDWLGRLAAPYLSEVRDHAETLADRARTRGSELAEEAGDGARSFARTARKRAGAAAETAQEELSSWTRRARDNGQWASDNARRQGSSFASRAWNDLVSLAEDAKDRGYRLVKDTRKEARRWI